MVAVVSVERLRSLSGGDTGVPTFSYLPYAFLNLVNPLVSIAMAYLGIAVFRVGKSDPVKGKVEETPSEA